MLLAYARHDLLLPGIRLVKPGLYHVDDRSTVMTLADVVAQALGTDARIGGLDYKPTGNKGLDLQSAAETRATGISAVQALCALAGTDIQEHFADAARKQLKACIEAPDHFLKDALSPLLTSRQHFHIPYQNDPVATAQLQKEYPELHLTTGTTHQPHAYAASARLAGEELILRKFNYSPQAVVPPGYDVLYKDIGGNPSRHATHGRYNIHCCTPPIDLRDSARETTRSEIMWNAVGNGKLSKKMYEAYHTKAGTKQRCYQRGELCQYKAKFAFMIHSQYDVDLAAFQQMLDVTEPIMLISVVNFVPAIMYAEQGCDGLMGLNWYKSDGRIHFDFVNDPSMGYSHKETQFIEMITAQVVVTPKGRVYLCERFVRGDAMFLQYTYCSIQPETMDLRAEYALWDAYRTDKVILCGWEFDHRRFADSKFSTPNNRFVRFTRRFIEIDGRFFELMYIHCIRSGDKSYNFNEVFSAGATFCTKMSINGNDVRAVNRVPVSELVLAIVTIYCIAYRDRYQAGKSIEAFVASEKDARQSGHLGLTACFSAAWKVVTDRSGIISTCLDKWNEFVDSVANIHSKSDLDVRMLGAVRCVRFSEFITVSGEFESNEDGLRDLSIGHLDIEVDKDGLLTTVVNVMRERVGSPEVQAKAAAEPVIPMVKVVKPKADDPMDTVPPLQRVYPHEFNNAVFPGMLVNAASNKSARGLKNNFHAHMTKTENPAQLKELRSAKYTCTVRVDVVPVAADGNCLFTALAHYTGSDVASMRRLLYDASTVKDEDMLLMDGSRKSWGSTDSVTVFSRVYQCRVCIHMVENGATCETMVYTDSSVPETAPVHHIRWKISGNVLGVYSAHVDVLVPREEVPAAWKTMFAAVRLLPHHATDEYRDFNARQQLKGLSLLDAVSRRLDGMAVLELGAAPGTWTRMLLPVVVSTGGVYHAVSHVGGLKYYDDIGDFDCENAKFFDCDAMLYLTNNSTKYDLVLCDIADSDSWLRGGAQIGVLYQAQTALKEDGNLVVKLSNAFLTDADTCLNSMKTKFAAVTVVKPDGCRMRNSECYVVATGYGGVSEYSDPVVDRKSIATAVGNFCTALTSGATLQIVQCDEKYCSLREKFLSVKAATPALDPVEPVLASFLAEVLPKTEVANWEGLEEWLHGTWPQGDMYLHLLDVGVYTERAHYDVDDVASRFALTNCAYLCNGEMPAVFAERFVPVEAATAILADEFDPVHFSYHPTVYVTRVRNPSAIPVAPEGYEHSTIHRARYTAFNDPSVFVVYSKDALTTVGVDWRAHMRAGIAHAAAGKAPIPVELLAFQLKGLTAGGVLEDMLSLKACPEHPEDDSGCHTCVYINGQSSQPGVLQAAWRRVLNYARTLPSESVRDYFDLMRTIPASEEKHVGAWMSLLRHREQGRIENGQVVSFKEPPVVRLTKKYLPVASCARAAIALEPGMATIVDSEKKQRITTRTYGMQSTLTVSYHGVKGKTFATRGSSMIGESTGVVRRTHDTQVSVQDLRLMRHVATSTTTLIEVVTDTTFEPVRFPSTRKLVSASAQTDEDAAFPALVLWQRSAPVKKGSPPVVPGVLVELESDLPDDASYGSTITPDDVSAEVSKDSAWRSDATSETIVSLDTAHKAKEMVEGKPNWRLVCERALKRVRRKSKRSDTESLLGSGVTQSVPSLTQTIPSLITGASSLDLGSGSLFSRYTVTSASSQSDGVSKAVACAAAVGPASSALVELIDLTTEPSELPVSEVLERPMVNSAQSARPEVVPRTAPITASPATAVVELPGVDAPERRCDSIELKTLCPPSPLTPPVPAPRRRTEVASQQPIAIPPVPAKRQEKPKLSPVVEEIEMTFVNTRIEETNMSREEIARYAEELRKLNEAKEANSAASVKSKLPGASIPATLPPGFRQAGNNAKPAPAPAPAATTPDASNKPVPASGPPSKTVPGPNQSVSMAELRDSLPRNKAKDTLATRSIWTAYPNDCKVHLALCHQSGDTLVLPPSIAKRVGADVATVKAVRAAGFADVSAPQAGWRGLWRGTDRHEVLVPVATGNHEQVLRAVLEWMPPDVSRVAIEASAELGDAALANLVRDLGRLVCLVDSRTRSWRGVMHILEPLKNPLPTTTNTNAFPKLSRKEKGLIDDPPWIKVNSNVDKFRNSMIEFKYLTANSDNYNKAEFRNQQLHPKNGPPSDKLGSMARAGYNVYDQETQTYLVQNLRQQYSHAYSPSLDTYVPWDDKKRRFQTGDRYVLTSKFTEIMLNQKILVTIEPFNVLRMEMPEIEWINGPPGCGKTYTIVQTTTISTSATEGRDLVLSMTTEGKLSVQAAVKVKNPSLDAAALKAHIRTVASLFANGTSLVYERVLIDEALMSHAGMIGYVAALTRTRKILIIGDIHQIPYVDRDHMCNVKYYSPACFTDITSFKEITYRCPIDTTYALSSLYPGFCTSSTVVTSMRRLSYAAEYSGIVKDLEECLYLVHFQSDKDYLIRERFGTGRGSRVLTIHEAQGLTFRHVVCIRTNARPLALYSDPPYAVVAVSRHTQSFRYYTDHDDAITDLIQRAWRMDRSQLTTWNTPRLSAAKERVAKEEAKRNPPKLTAGGLMFEAETYLRPLQAEHDETLVKGLPAATHLPLVPVVPKRVSWASFFKPAKYKMAVEEDINYLQAFYDSAMPGVSCWEYRNDQLLMEMEDTTLFSTDVEIIPIKGVYQPPKFGKLRPRIRTIMQARKVPSQKESVLGAIKRNLNSPQLANQNLSPEALGERLFLNFTRSGIDQSKLHLIDMYQKDPVTISSPIVSAWLEKQPPARRAQIVSDLPLHLRPYNRFSYMVKADVKPQLTPGAQTKYPSVQTIVYNDPCVNAIFCPIYNVLFERLISVLHPKVLMYTGMSAGEFELELNAKLDARVAYQCKTIENDFSKYDKAQQAALRRYERLLWEYVGLDSELSQIWDDSRRESTVTDRRNGVRFRTTFQRKSGEATTFSGNTLVALSIVLAVMDIDDIALVMVAGDDSMVYLRPDAEFADSSKLIADLFNLECKLLQAYKVPYFCSKFLVTTQDWTYVVHDPLKFVTKLGRLDMSNYQHVEEYRVSCVDTMKSLFNPIVIQGLSVGVMERYGGGFGDLTKLLCVLKTLCHSPERFASLFVHDRGVTLCHDVSSRKLD
uniref:Replicase large subunit n=1 Tax=Atrato Virga-like virus 3 TaxID=2689342 RepID=A0A6B9KNJ1_9VIRU|nr:polyprotein [Atrato Virga-like virus 3]